MAFKELTDELNQKRQKVKELSATISVYAMKPVGRQVKGKEQELRERLDFRLKELTLEFELRSLGAKIKIMEELVDILKRGQLNK